MGSRAPGQKCTRWGGRAPTRGRVPDGGQSARWEAVHLDRTAPDGKQSATRGCAPGQKCTRWGVEHPMGSSTPGQNGCNAHRSGVVPSPTSTNGAHCRLPGHEAPLRLVGQSAVRVGGDAERGPSTWIAVRVGTMAAPPRPPPRRVDRGACGGRRRAWAIDVDLGAACASVGGHARVAAGMGAGRLGRLGSLDGGLSAVDGDVAVDDDARFRREEAGHRRLAL